MSTGSNTPEIFLPTPGYPGYRVSDHGRVQSSWHSIRVGVGPQPVGPWYDLKLEIDHKGYARVRLRMGPRVNRKRFVQQLVLEAFIGPCPAGMEACHSPDPNPSNNHLSNLRWDTPSANNQDQWAHGTMYKGEQVWDCKLTEEKVRDIVVRLLQGTPKLQLAREYGVSDRTIYGIAKGKSWVWVTGGPVKL